ncbi:MAG: hypothetical protein ABIO78_05915 [Thermoanaerobaculia bacterium]
MTTAVSDLYEPLIERDPAAIRTAIRRFRQQQSSDELFLAIARFAVLAYAPSQHAKHSVLSVLSAHDLREDLGERFDEVLIECAIYAANSRQPWSEPPIMDPPSPHGAPGDLRVAVVNRDRMAAERWLAKRLDDPDLRRELIAIASEDLEDLGHKVIIANAAWRLAEILGEKGRFVALRMAVWEMVSYAGPPSVPGPLSKDVLDGLIARCVAGNGSIESAHAVFLFDALSGGEQSVPGDPPPVYRLARDYGQCLKAHAVAKRLRRRYPEAHVDDFIAAVRRNLETGPSYEEWTFA